MSSSPAISDGARARVASFFINLLQELPPGRGPEAGPLAPQNAQAIARPRPSRVIATRVPRAGTAPALLTLTRRQPVRCVHADTTYVSSEGGREPVGAHYPRSASLRLDRVVDAERA